MSDDLSQELRAFEGSDALGAGDFSVCIRGADRIEAQAAHIAELESRLQEATRLLLQAHDTIFRLHENNDTAARNLITKIRVGFSGTLIGGKDG